MAELILSQVSKYFGDSIAVNQLNLVIPQGAFVALLGPSGCGKTTTLRMIAGFETLSKGEILLNGKSLARPEWQIPTESRNMGMVFQSYALWPHMSVYDNVGYPLRHRGIKGNDFKKRVNEALSIVQLENLATRMPQDLSGGQRQRVALARCLVTDPEVVLLDEPLANLDRHLRASMEESFREFHQRTGTTLIYVTHDQSEAMSLADQIAVMHQGNLVQWSKPEALYNTPKNEWIASFIGQGSILRLPGVMANQHLGEQDIALLLKAPIANQADTNTPVLIRPEHIRLQPLETATTDHDEMPGSRGKILRCVYKGERYEVEAVLSNQQRITCYHSSPISIGSTVQLTFLKGWSLES